MSVTVSGSAAADSTSGPRAAPVTRSAAPPLAPREKSSALVIEAVTCCLSPVLGDTIRPTPSAAVRWQRLCIQERREAPYHLVTRLSRHDPAPFPSLLLTTVAEYC